MHQMKSVKKCSTTEETKDNNKALDLFFIFFIGLNKILCRTPADRMEQL
jgi:hypothetical protein